MLVYCPTMLKHLLNAGIWTESGPYLLPSANKLSSSEGCEPSCGDLPVPWEEASLSETACSHPLAWLGCTGHADHEVHFA